MSMDRDLVTASVNNGSNVSTSCQLVMLGMQANTFQQLLTHTNAETLTLAKIASVHLLRSSADILMPGPSCVTTQEVAQH